MSALWTLPTGHATGLRVWNSLTHRIDPLVLRHPPVLTWYTCGPTVYDHSHLGHARTYVTVDMMMRTLSDVFGVPVLSAMNITDIDDKIIAKAVQEQSTHTEIAQKFERAFWDDMALLGVRRPHVVPRVTDHVEGIVQFVQALVKKDFAYATPSGVYFDVTKGRDYGNRLLQRIVVQNENSADVSAGESAVSDGRLSDKRDPRDFALWKCRNPSDVGNAREVLYDSPWGQGRPGWHIECSAMSAAIFGQHLAVHAGGVDLRFPHHENEIAQSEAYSSCCPTGHSHQHSQNLHGSDGSAQLWCDYFLHIGHLYIAGRKMSKSLKNFITIRELLEDHSADEFRMFCALHHFSSRADFSADTSMLEPRRLVSFFSDFLAEAADRSAFARRRSLSDAVLAVRFGPVERELLDSALGASSRYRAALADNFDFGKAIDNLRQAVDAVRLYWSKAHVVNSAMVENLQSSIAHMLSEPFGFRFASPSSVLPEPSKAVQSSSLPSDQLVDDLLSFRSQMRNHALGIVKSSKPTTAAGGAATSTDLAAMVKQWRSDGQFILNACDHVRDKVLADKYGILAQDTADGSFFWKRSNSERGHSE